MHFAYIYIIEKGTGQRPVQYSYTKYDLRRRRPWPISYS